MQQDSSGSEKSSKEWTPDIEWIRRVCTGLESDEEYLKKSRYFRASILVIVGEREFSIDTWHGKTVWTQEGRQISGFDFAIRASDELWTHLAGAQDDDFGKALTGHGSNFVIENNQALAASGWAPVYHLIKALVRGAKKGKS